MGPLPAEAASRHWLGTLPTPDPSTSLSKASSRFLSRDEPFGITTIIGGTNVRFCLSISNHSEPLIYSIKWQELNALLTDTLAAEQLEFENAKEHVFRELAAHFVDFVASKLDASDLPPPFNHISSFNFSVAGLVFGHGVNAAVTTSNTGVLLKNEVVALSLYSAINSELRQRAWPTISTDNISVMNDATAGLLGELHAGALQGCQNGLFVIIGTGVGSMGLVQGAPCDSYAEIGHRIIWDAIQKRFIFLENDAIQSKIDEDGSFKPLAVGQRYLENDLAGPWLAIRFLKKLSDNDSFMPMLHTLAEIIKGDMPSDYRGNLDEDLADLSDLQNKARLRWAINSPSSLVKAVNQFVLNPDPVKVQRSLPCDFNIQALCELHPEKGLILMALAHWKQYFKEIGRALGEAYQKMHQDGCPPQKIVIGGGIGEACARYPEHLKTEALETIHCFGKLPPHIVVFSSMSPEERESTVTAAAVDREWQKRRAASSLILEMSGSTGPAH